MTLDDRCLLTEFSAKGHPNIRCRHGSTIMVTRDPYVSTRGDCVVAVGAEKALNDLPQEFKAAARNPGTDVTLTIEVGPHRFTVAGEGHPNLTYCHLSDMVARRSFYTCSRTLMVGADKVARDIPREMVSALQDPDSEIKITLSLRKSSDLILTMQGRGGASEDFIPSRLLINNLRPVKK